MSVRVCICRICECTKVYKCKCKCKCKLETNLYAVYIVHQECMHYFDNGTLRASELLHLLHYCIDPFWPLRLALSPILSSTVYRTINNHSLSSKTFSALQYPLHSSPTLISPQPQKRVHFTEPCPQQSNNLPAHHPPPPSTASLHFTIATIALRSWSWGRGPVPS